MDGKKQTEGGTGAPAPAPLVVPKMKRRPKNKALWGAPKNKAKG